MGLAHSYHLLAPIYDLFVGSSPLSSARRHSLAQLGDISDNHVLLCGIGTGLDVPMLPAAARYIGIDLTSAMLQRARRRITDNTIQLHQGDVMQLPYADTSFDTVLMHLILAVVPEPPRALAEAARVLRPGGRIYILDKFLRPGQRAPLRRLFNPVVSRLATRLDVVFEEVLQQNEGLEIITDEPALAGGWFRHIVLEKNREE
jgi:ubiquinone/menaquinone biosynthesis C-methylase UbiE